MLRKSSACRCRSTLSTTYKKVPISIFNMRHTDRISGRFAMPSANCGIWENGPRFIIECLFCRWGLKHVEQRYAVIDWISHDIQLSHASRVICMEFGMIVIPLPGCLAHEVSNVARCLKKHSTSAHSGQRVLFVRVNSFVQSIPSYVQLCLSENIVCFRNL